MKMSPVCNLGMSLWLSKKMQPGRQNNDGDIHERQRVSRLQVLQDVAAGRLKIGEATALHFAEEGAKVVVADLDAERGKTIEAQIREKGR